MGSSTNTTRRSVAMLLGMLAAALPAAVSAAPPTANYLFPAGAQRGQSIVVTVAGDFSNWPVRVWCDHSGVSATANQEKGQLQVNVAADATPGVAWLRLYDDEGASALRPFAVGTVAEVAEVEPNDAPAEGQAIDGPRVVNGRLQKRGDVDGFSVRLKRGETLVAALSANSILGSPVDTVLQICELVERKPLADAKPQLEAYVIDQNHDAVGLDPRVVFKAPSDGTYLVRIFGFPSQPDSTISLAGGDDYVYRLTLTTGPYVAAALPLAVQTDQRRDIQLIGWNLPDALRRVAPASEIVFHADATGYVSLTSVDHPVMIAGDESKPQDVPLPVTISGQMLRARESHTFRFAVIKDSKVRLAVAAHGLGYPLDPQLTITDDDGKVLLEGDDNQEQFDPQLLFTPPADGHCRVVVGDIASGSGPTFVYQLTIEPAAADFALSLASDRFTIAADKPLEIPVTVDRRGAFAAPIKIRAVGLPPSIVSEETTSQPTGDSAAAVKLILKRTPDGSFPTSAAISIEGVAEGDFPRQRRATFDLNLPLARRHRAVWLAAPH